MDLNNLLSRALTVMNERQREMNTASRIGSLFRDMINFTKNITGGTCLLGEKDNAAAIRTIANPKRGDTWKAFDTSHYWTFDGGTWNDIGEIIPSDVASKKELSESQLASMSGSNIVSLHKGGYVNSVGGITSDNPENHKYILFPVKVGQVYVIISDRKNTNCAYMVSEKEQLSKFTLEIGKNEITIPQNANFLAVTLEITIKDVKQGDWNKQSIMLKTPMLDSFLSFEDSLSLITKDSFEVKKAVSSLADKSKNLFNHVDIIEGKYIITSNGNLGNLEDCAISNLIPVKGGSKYTLSGRNSNSSGMIFYDDKGTKLKPINPDTGEEMPLYSLGTDNGVVLAPSTATHVQFLVRFSGKGTYEKIQLEEGNVQTEYKPYGYTIKENALGDLGVVELKSQIETLEGINDEIVEIDSKNKFTGETLLGYLNSTGGFTSHDSGKYVTTDLIPVKPDTFYYISNRGELKDASNLRCLDQKGNPIKVLVATTGEEFRSWGMPNADGTAIAYNGMIKTPPLAVSMQINLIFNSIGTTNLMLEEVGSTYDPEFTPSAYQPYKKETKIKESVLPKKEQSTTSSSISLKTVPTLLITGSSHCEGFGAVKDKSFASFISALTDWNVENYSLTGSDYIEHFNLIVSGKKIGDLHPSQLNGGYVLVSLGGNESNYRSRGVDAKYFRQNIIRYCSAMKSLGFKPILCSYFGDMQTPWSMVVYNVAMEYGYPYFDFNGNGSKYYRQRYEPWWYVAHYATRTNAIMFYNAIKALRELDRPSTALKIFRNRIPVGNISELLFDDNYEKMKYWHELTIHHQPLNSKSQKYVDRLDLATSANISSVNSEYNNFRQGGSIRIDKYGLIQVVFPSHECKDIKLFIDTNDAINVYIRKYTLPELEVSLSDAGASFAIVSEMPNIAKGDIYTDSNNGSVRFTVIEINNGVLITTANGAFSADGSVNGTLTKVSGSGDELLDYNYVMQVPGANYFNKAFTKKGSWSKLTKKGDFYSLKSLTGLLDYDRLDILIEGASLISDVHIEYQSEGTKAVKMKRESKLLAFKDNNEQILSKTTFADAVIDWNAPAEAVIWDGKTELGNHIPNYFTNIGASKILRLNKGQAVHQLLPSLGKRYESNLCKIKLIARYYPTEAIDIDNLPKDVRTSSSFDFGKIELKIAISKDAYFSKEVYAPLSWVEIEEEFILNGLDGLGNNELTITAIDDNVELLMCEVYH